MPGLLPAAFGAVTAGLGVLFSGGLTAASYRAEKEAVGRDNAEGFKPASKITTFTLRMVFIAAPYLSSQHRP